MPLPLAVADTSVLINLHHLEHLNSLSLFYRQVLVPSPVRTQFLKRDDSRSREIVFDVLTRHGFFSPCDDYDSVEVDLFKLDKMDEGEAEALSQLKIRQADVLLIDERIGRKIAEREMRRVSGTASILVRLSVNGFTDYWQSIDRLRSESGFRISDEVAQEALDNVMKNETNL